MDPKRILDAKRHYVISAKALDGIWLVMAVLQCSDLLSRGGGFVGAHESIGTRAHVLGYARRLAGARAARSVVPPRSRSSRRKSRDRNIRFLF